MRRWNFCTYRMTVKYKLKHIFQFCHVLKLFDRKQDLTLYIYTYIYKYIYIYMCVCVCVCVCIAAVNITTTSLKIIVPIQY
jgi:hypothetical protein